MADETIAVGSGNRRVEDIALDLMKFIAMTSGYGKPAAPAGFQARADKAEDVVDALLKLYERCRAAVEREVQK
jgi:hypothetical protein